MDRRTPHQTLIQMHLSTPFGFRIAPRRGNYAKKRAPPPASLDGTARWALHANPTAWRKRGDFFPGTNLKPWVLNIAWFEVLNYRKQQAMLLGRSECRSPNFEVPIVCEEPMDNRRRKQQTQETQCQRMRPLACWVRFGVA